MGFALEGMKAKDGRGLFGDFFGPEITDGQDAADLIAQGNKKAIGELRRSFGDSETALTPFIEGGHEAFQNVQNASTPQGLDRLLRSIMSTKEFGGLVDESQRRSEDALTSAGLFRSGAAADEAARIPRELALAIENMLTGRNQQTATEGKNTSINLENFRSNLGSNIANIHKETGQARSSGFLTDVQADAQRDEDSQNNRLLVASMFFSDPSLKSNIEEIGSIGGLSIYQWDWDEDLKDTCIAQCDNMGFMADEVKVKYPEHVENVCGFDVINYPALLDELEAV